MMALTSHGSSRDAEAEGHRHDKRQTAAAEHDAQHTGNHRPLAHQLLAASMTGGLAMITMAAMLMSQSVLSQAMPSGNSAPEMQRPNVMVKAGLMLRATMAALSPVAMNRASEAAPSFTSGAIRRQR